METRVSPCSKVAYPDLESACLETIDRLFALNEGEVFVDDVVFYGVVQDQHSIREANRDFVGRLCYFL